NPIEKGHTLVVPREHCETVMDAPETVLSRTIATVQKVACALVKGGAVGVNVLQNNGPAAGQAVPHLHFHVIPRYATPPHAWANGAGKYATDAERDAYADRIRKSLS
ncbi:MAG: HIT domain-containing protein, partial [Kiritimatiellaeota bacterium]|nr:HIT domain-containing protein [Kiritimatiellota bacterium]